MTERTRGAVFSPQPDRVAIVTGGTDGIGYSTAKYLARLGMHVIIAGNNEDKADEAVRKIKGETLNDRVEFLYCDLASMQSIRRFVQKFQRKRIPLHVLVNNAGVMMVPQRKTVDGFEEHLGLNYLGHFLLTNLLLDTLRDSGSPGRSARVVTVSSATHYVGELNLGDLQGSRSYSPHGAYAQSKLALVLFTYHLQGLLAAQGSPVTANVADPGVVDTDLYKHVFWPTRLVKKLFGRWFFKVSPRRTIIIITIITIINTIITTMINTINTTIINTITITILITTTIINTTIKSGGWRRCLSSEAAAERAEHVQKF
ncbi:dehydrogenase/reductase SDR family member on chromosome X [Equus quagga]|uniref:dehydrogenase/reductase SDR family member on chromosome X n=1 Tax=Equus quagga TaxID=89248 RepID=UPI001EE25373|nr:dehydrogenase/reductase SDR family member on chromosome X [Equus quagga]